MTLSLRAASRFDQAMLASRPTPPRNRNPAAGSGTGELKGVKLMLRL
jgi:hypothetical protein